MNFLGLTKNDLMRPKTGILHTAVKTKNSRINLFFAVIHFVELVRSVYNEYN